MKNYQLKVIHRKKNENHSFDIQIASTAEEFEELAGMTALGAANLLYTAKLERSLRARIWPALKTVERIDPKDAGAIESYISGFKLRKRSKPSEPKVLRMKDMSPEEWEKIVAYRNELQAESEKPLEEATPKKVKK